MEREKLESLLIDYIDGKLTNADRLLIEDELKHNTDAFILHGQLSEVFQAINASAELAPSSSLKTKFDSMLNDEIQQSRKSRSFFLQPGFYRVAAAVTLLIIGGGAGFWISQYQRKQEELAAIQKLRDDNKNTMMAMLDNDLSASQRVLGANVAYRMDKPDDEIVLALVNALNEDPNTNVRLAALDALGKFHNQPHVRKALIKALQKQQDPMVQIALIRLMVEMKEKEVIQELQRITTDDEVLPAVKDEAHAGILRLS